MADNKLRIISGPPAVVEGEVNELLDNYAPLVWNIQEGRAGPLVTCILIHQAEVRKAQILAAAMPAVRPG